MGVLLMLGLAACSSTPFEYHDSREIPEGPGMFTGEEGAVRMDRDAASSPGGTSADCACPEGRELQAYREFLRWKADAVGTPEYREFRQWRQWRRERSGSE